ncbi:putative Hydroxymethylglutaryl-CoA reductase (NADPH) [Vibrio nigripulchritudo MADA3029]|uniref:hydroxymethylglutaryl-CoA reductase (NADPH) n=1 Tax=Vibrio nigripulchritudo TaxID=28173 RepID=U4K6U9_9VIBR|nr:hydroxymethylglutaryl-CoA reductase [Vibrio nigripulchritudo]CCN48516.1 putative Hydroxymethylglutaryl-CoA reductase (NADPH) [Vibrio nigripulchritudo MADA3020]CCN55616.1 putative Hydroxymethylglutaryl-CoA reductase (NADPH) [Vibrio nigripulchritudo MADA3021]CCN60723.1 putative Hydroxymethylglutaryl-CoA reductase (NADPH) [Vibrio nigripulchritudo MADA3029]CCN80947.1 putative Hydroxymethylglutaryl-CoA reductase (NADPH) [Vibrio nigripulchritudo BLFn1]CCN89182.1 putative Hydroxymethylglutaryl-CoA
MPKLNALENTGHYSIQEQCSLGQIENKLAPDNRPPVVTLPRSPFLTDKAIQNRWAIIDDDALQEVLLDPATYKQRKAYSKNIENFIGSVKMPLGVAGPLRVNGLFAKDDYLVPLATTEAALVASYHRGCQLVTASGGASAMLINEGVTRTPAFMFDNLAMAGQFVGWATSQYDTFKSLAESTTRHGKLKDISITIESNQVFLVFEFLTGDASGQNMVTIATNAVFEYILKHSPMTPNHAILDGNLSGDKKANAHTMRSVRGKKVSAEVHISREMVKKYLHTNPEDMVKFGQITTSGALLSGSIGVNAHFANALAALYIACGQDAACVAESAVGMSRMSVKEDGSLYASVTLPNLMLGTVGGGTGLPSQKACLDIMGLSGTGKAKALAEVCASLCLAGELSIVGAFCAGHFTKAHSKLSR